MENHRLPPPPPPRRGSSSSSIPLHQHRPSTSSFPGSYHVPLPPQPPTPPGGLPPFSQTRPSSSSSASRNTPFFHTLPLPIPSSTSPRTNTYFPASPRDVASAPSPSSASSLPALRIGGGGGISGVGIGGGDGGGAGGLGSLELGIADPSSWAAEPKFPKNHHRPHPHESKSGHSPTQPQSQLPNPSSSRTTWSLGFKSESETRLAPLHARQWESTPQYSTEHKPRPSLPHGSQSYTQVSSQSQSTDQHYRSSGRRPRTCSMESGQPISAPLSLPSRNDEPGLANLNNSSSFDVLRNRNIEDSSITETVPSMSILKEKRPSSSLTADDSNPLPTDDQQQQPKKKKRRQALSCAECSKRKQKCNREQPCQHCVSRKVPHLCVPVARTGGSSPTDTPRKSTSAVAPYRGSGERREKIENLAKDKDKEGEEEKNDVVKPEGKVAKAKISLSGGQMTTKVKTSETLAARLSVVEKVIGAVLEKVEGIDTSILIHPPISPPAPVVEGPEPDPDGDTADSEENWAGLDQRTNTRNPLPQIIEGKPAHVSLILDTHGTVDESLQRLFSDYGVDPKRLRDSIQDLPTKERADSLVEWFFEKFNHVRYPIDRRYFDQAYEMVYSASEVIRPAVIIALPLVFIVLAIAIRIKPDVGVEEQRRLWSLKLYWRSTTSIRLATALSSEHIQLVETRLLTGLYLVLMHERRLAEGWQLMRAAVTTGQAIGLHRDGAKLHLEPYMTEYRRRLWSYLCHADATYSCLLGRPTMIDPIYTDTRPPSNVSDMTETTPEPMNKPTFATYLILRLRLAEVVAMIVKHFQRLHGQMQYDDVEAINAEFERLRGDLPPQFMMLNPDKSYDKELWYLKLHRYYIQTEILHFTIILHRPWLLRKIKSGRYKLSRNACFEAAVTDFKIRQAFKIDCPDFFETLIGGSFREFNTAMIAGIGLLIEPDSSRCHDLWQIMGSYMDHHPHDPFKDEFTKSEAAIIYKLHKRALELHSNRSKPLTVQTSYERAGSGDGDDGVDHDEDVDEDGNEAEGGEEEGEVEEGERNGEYVGHGTIGTPGGQSTRRSIVHSRRESNIETPRSNEDVGQQMLNQFLEFGPTTFEVPSDSSLYFLRNMPKEDGYYDPTWQTPVVAGAPPSTSYFTNTSVAGYMDIGLMATSSVSGAMVNSLGGAKMGESSGATPGISGGNEETGLTSVDGNGGTVGSVSVRMSGVGSVGGLTSQAIIPSNFIGPGGGTMMRFGGGLDPTGSQVETPFNEDYWERFISHIQYMPNGP